jgi:hypothetical protein
MPEKLRKAALDAVSAYYGTIPGVDITIHEAMTALNEALTPAPVAAPSAPAQEDGRAVPPGTERAFAEWLNDRRDRPVAEVFHDIVIHYREALAAPAPAAPSLEQGEAQRLDPNEADPIVLWTEIARLRADGFGDHEAMELVAAYLDALEATLPDQQAAGPGEQQDTSKLNAIGQLVQRLAEQSPQLWCLIGPDGRCWLGPDPLALAAQAGAPA